LSDHGCRAQTRRRQRRADPDACQLRGKCRGAWLSRELSAVFFVPRSWPTGRSATACSSARLSSMKIVSSRRCQPEGSNTSVLRRPHSAVVQTRSTSTAIYHGQCRAASKQVAFSRCNIRGRQPSLMVRRPHRLGSDRFEGRRGGAKRHHQRSVECMPSTRNLRFGLNIIASPDHEQSIICWWIKRPMRSCDLRQFCFYGLIGAAQGAGQVFSRYRRISVLRSLRSSVVRKGGTATRCRG